jgi:hypothetical protein
MHEYERHMLHIVTGAHGLSGLTENHEHDGKLPAALTLSDHKYVAAADK